MNTSVLPISQNRDVVTFRIEVNGEPLPQTHPVFYIEITHEVNRIPTACIGFADGDASLGEWPLSNEEFFIPGNEIKIFAGYQSEDEELFSGIVIGQALRVRDRHLELQITCKDKAVKMTTTKKSRHFAEMTDSDAAAEILGEYAIADHLTTTNTEHVDLVQYDSTDWDFIIMRMEANGLVCIADADGFHTIAPSIDEDPVAMLRFGTSVLEFDADIDARRQFGAVTVKAWDQASQDSGVGESVEPQWKTVGDLAPADLAEAVGAAAQAYRHGGVLSADELQSWSDASLLRSRMAFVRGRARVFGFAALKPASVIELAGFGDRFNGPVWVSAVRHEINHGNWISDVELGMSEEWHMQRLYNNSNEAQNIVPSVRGLHTGIVTALEGDPAGEVRIKVKIPSIDTEGDGQWARIATLDAGASRGTFFLPEIDDEVIIGFLGDDPRHPVILGMLHSSAHTPPEDAKDDNHIKGYFSRTGMRIRFDDEKTIMTIDTPGGHVIVLDDDAGEIIMTDSSSNKITMSSSGINLESASDLVLKAKGGIKIEGGANIEMKATAQWKAEGSAGLEINSSAVTVVKGSLVQIN
ncbi:MAG TPA: type VI secretion system tip protein VgrG [Saprospiraceae bacterium]|nr:type VI secretion system tip protein VgrG [Saprospiraceae bacterium]